MENDKWLILLLSLGLGLLVGMQRESAKSKTAGIRTFPLITLTGTVCGLLAKEFDAWILAVGLLAITLLLVVGNLHRMKNNVEGSGITTEIAVLFMYAMGAYLVFGEMMIAVVLTGVVTVLLHFKATLHGWVDRFGADDLRAIMQFVLISMIILPILPDITYDRYDSLNPKNIWLMVVLIVGISLVGYFIYKFIGSKAGVLLGGILGGLISSTATTVSYSRMARNTEAVNRLAAFVILTASAVSMVRVMIEISVVAPSSFRSFIYPLAAELLVMIILVVILFFRNREEKAKMPEQSNPAELKGALIFALLYGAISFTSAAVKDNFGDQALYIVSIISGLTDLDAITLSTAKMSEQNGLEPGLGWRLILVATLSNLVFKAGMAMVMGNRKLGRIVGILFGILIISGLLIIFFWPSQL
ncbi:MAG TPA: MgtC/SapB family protein [Chitinophagaceae bacterium]|nr:MgtC/SapB family protein [Chitinophagaceae bacterium]